RLDRFAHVLAGGLANALADRLAQPLPSHRDDALADFGLDPFADPRGDLCGVVAADLLGDGPLGQRLLNRGGEPFADDLSNPPSDPLAHPLVDDFGEALAQSVAGAIEVESTGSALRLDERRADVLSQPLTQQIAHAVPDRVLQTLPYRLGHPLPQDLP